jgi:HEAT repeat protein
MVSKMAGNGFRKERAWPHRLLAVLLTVLAILWLPSGLGEPHEGPPHSVAASSLRRHLPEELLDYVQIHGGRFPSTLHPLIPRHLGPVRDVEQLRRAWNWRIGMAKLPHLALGTLGLWVLVIWARRDRFMWGLAIAFTCLAGVTSAVVWKMSRVDPPSFGYVDQFALLPNVEDPLPYEIPMLWDRHSMSICIRGENWPDAYMRWRWVAQGSDCPFSPARVENGLRSVTTEPMTWLELARNGDMDALLVLAVTKSQDAADFLLNSAREQTGIGQRVALWGLYLRRHDRAAELAAHALTASDPLTRAYAAEVFGRIQPPGTTRLLLPLLNDKHWLPVEAALRYVGCDGDGSALPALRKALQDRSRAVLDNEPLLQAIARVQMPEAVDILVEHIREVKGTGYGSAVAEIVPIRILGESGPVAVPALRNLLDDKTYPSEERRALLLALAQAGGETVVEHLISHVSNSYEAVGEALARTGQKGEAILLKWAGSKRLEERIAASVGLGYCEGDAAVRALIKLLADDSIACINAAYSLGRLRDARATGPLVKYLNDSNGNMRRAVAGALWAIADPRCLPALREAARKERTGVADVPFMRPALQELEAYAKYLKDHPDARTVEP